MTVASKITERMKIFTEALESGTLKIPENCAECGRDEVRPVKISYSGIFKLTTINIAKLEVNQCQGCKEIFFTDKSHKQMSEALKNTCIGCNGRLGWYEEDQWISCLKCEKGKEKYDREQKQRESFAKRSKEQQGKLTVELDEWKRKQLEKP